MTKRQQLSVLGQFRADQHCEQVEWVSHQPVDKPKQHLPMVAVATLIAERNPSSHSTKPCFRVGYVMSGYGLPSGARPPRPGLARSTRHTTPGGCAARSASRRSAQPSWTTAPARSSAPPPLVKTCGSAGTRGYSQYRDQGAYLLKEMLVIASWAFPLIRLPCDVSHVPPLS